MRYRIVLVSIIALLALAACNLTSGPENEPITTAAPQASAKPVVNIVTPNNGDTVPVNQPVLVSASASDSVGVQRVQLLANGQIVKTVSSQSATGDVSLNVLLDYTPRTQGDVNLQVVAYRGAIASDPAQITVHVGGAQPTATSAQSPNNPGVPSVPNVPVINPNDPTCRVLTNVGLNFRTGPSTNYNVLTVIPAGTQVPIIGRLGTNEWWQLRYNNTIGWVSAAFATVYGNCGSVPVVNPPPTPTSAVAPTATTIPTQPVPPTNVPPATAVPGPADLVVSNISGPQDLSLSGASEVTGTYAVTITNTGSTSTAQFNNVIIRTPGNVEIPLGVVATLGPTQSIVLTVDITFDAAGSYTLQVRTDYNSNVTEQSEVNNFGIYTVTVNS
jgi:hypothetical protein